MSELVDWLVGWLRFLGA